MIEPLPTWDSEATRQTFHDGTFENWILGRKVQKHRFDLKRLMVAIDRFKPEAIVETGTRWGGSAGWFADTARCKIVSVDIAPILGWTAKNRDQADRGIEYIVGDSTAPSVLERVSNAVLGLRTMVVLDSDHHSDHVLREIRRYGELVTRGGYLVVEDACFDFWDGDDSRRGGRQIPEVGGPYKAIDAAGLETDARWERAEDIEGMYSVSHSPCGWWKRK